MDAQEEDLDHGTRPPIHGQISIEHLSFRYDDGNQDVLRDVSFDVHPHETVAIMGPTGSGKSSLMHLLTALYPYEHGSIKLDGHELREMQNVTCVRKLVLCFRNRSYIQKQSMTTLV